MSKRIGFSTSKGFHSGEDAPFGIELDENGVLKFGDTIIPQKKLIWEGYKESGTTGHIITDLDINYGDNLIICLRTMNGTNCEIPVHVQDFFTYYDINNNEKSREGYSSSVAVETDVGLMAVPFTFSITEGTLDFDNGRFIGVEGISGTAIIITKIYKIIG